MKRETINKNIDIIKIIIILNIKAYYKTQNLKITIKEL